MKTHFEPLVLEKLRALFRDQASYDSFKERIIASLQTGFSPVIADGKIVGLAVSTDNGKELIYEMVTEQWARNPGLLDKLRQSLENEELVEAPELNVDSEKTERTVQR